jgi:uncharacterized glyoxalase superfamily protein PhnB
MAVPQRISLVTVGVSDVARSTAFYEALGWRRSGSSQESITFFQMQGSALALFGHEALAEDATIPAGDPPDASGFRGVTLAINCDSRDEVDRVFAQCVAAGASPVKQPDEVFWGGYTSYVADPDGHLWEVAHNPYATNDDDGRMSLEPPG